MPRDLGMQFRTRLEGPDARGPVELPVVSGGHAPRVYSTSHSDVRISSSPGRVRGLPFSLPYYNRSFLFFPVRFVLEIAFKNLVPILTRAHPGIGIQIFCC